MISTPAQQHWQQLRILDVEQIVQHMHHGGNKAILAYLSNKVVQTGLKVVQTGLEGG